MADEAAVDPAPDDLTSLPSLTDSAVLEACKLRFSDNKIYTKINSLLVAVNPFQRLPIYGDAVMKQYQDAAVGTQPPHIYSPAAASYTGLLAGSPQSLIISGESGAGKSESAKLILKHLAFCSTAPSDDGSPGVEDKILASSPPLEAFGNAKTPMNNNSSRYGKFIMLNFSTTGLLAGAHLNTYLLEKPRVVRPSAGERNYHIFYMLYTVPELWNELGLPPIEEITFVGKTGVLDNPGFEDAAEFKDTLDALAKIGLSADQMLDLWKLVAAIMLLGQVEFGTGDEAAVTEASQAALQAASDLVACDAEMLSAAMTTLKRKVRAGRRA